MLGGGGELLQPAVRLRGIGTGPVAAVQGQAVDIGGYYKPDFDKLEAIMRPSKTFNAALASVQA